MKRKQIIAVVFSIVALLGSMGSVGAAVIDGLNWADSVDEYSTEHIQNYAGTLMAAGPTTWWVTGKSDADVDGNDYAWDGVDNDYVAGWRANNPSKYITVQFDFGVADVTGTDLIIRMYGGSSASASVLGSTDGVSFTEIGTIGGGASGYLRDEEFDLAGKFASEVHYIKVLRVGNGAKTGMFFDSFASTAIPEPAIMVLLVCGGALGLLRRRRKF